MRASGTLRQFFQKHNRRSAERNQERIDAIYAAVSATNDAAVLEAGTLTARGLVALLRTLHDHIAELDRRIGQLVMAHPNGALFASLPGAGAVLVPRVIVALGTHRESYDSAFEVQCYSGIAPVKESSGKTNWVPFRQTCPTFLRQTFHEFAPHSINRSGPKLITSTSARTRTRRIRQPSGAWRTNGFASSFAAGRTANRLTRGLQSLRRRVSLIAGALGLPTGAGWQTVAGFQNLS